MAHKAKDGTEYTNRMMVNRHNSRMDSKQDDSGKQPTPPSADQSNSQSENPDADQHVDAMLGMGMSPDDIHQHAKKRSGQPQEQAPEQQGSALSSIPGM